MASDDSVPLTELDVITRWSLAVRQPAADRAELISVLRSDLQWLEDGAPMLPDPAEPVVATVAPARRASKPAAKRAAAKPAARRSTSG